MAVAPELIRFVRPPTALDLIYPFEIAENRRIFQHIRVIPEPLLQQLLAELLEGEVRIEQDFRTARAKLSHSESQVGGFETYGIGGKHYAFKNILIECGLEPKDEIAGK
jgi:hypothetical protein